MFRRIRDLREDHDLTQKHLAFLLNCSQQAYSTYELGQRDIPTDVLIKLALFYHVSSDYILEIDNRDLVVPLSPHPHKENNSTVKI